MVVKAPDPDRFLRWGDRDYVTDLDAHTVAASGALKSAVQKGGTAALEAKLREILARTFRAGHALGKAETEHALAEIVRERVARAISDVRVEAAKCPHCFGLGCDECGDTGRYREDMRLR